MSNFSHSFNQVHYGLRPNKQVERRMLVDGLQLLAEAGFGIRDYPYVGMGSVHFVDFSLFHKFLGIENMVSIEACEDIEKRVRFNVPFNKVVEVKTGTTIGEHITSLPDTDPHLVWLDYDNVLSESMLQDIALSASALARGSILLVTVDTEAPSNIGERKSDTKDNLDISQQYFSALNHVYFNNLPLEEYANANLPKVNICGITKAIEDGIHGRAEEFLPLFNFLYADGHRMLTIGGMIGNKKDKTRIKQSRFAKADYTRLSLTSVPYEIRVPILTRKEHIFLECEMPSPDGWIPLDFEISKNDIEAYRRVYRFCPSYAELLC